MSKPFDVTLKLLLERYPADWLRLVGVVPSGPIEIVESELAADPVAADKVFRLAEPAPWLLHLELQSSYDAELPDRIFLYNALLYQKHKLAVQSVAVLLRPHAGGPHVAGVVQRSIPGQATYVDFRYLVLRIWEHSPEEFLTGGLGVLPLAPLAQEAAPQLPEIVHRIDERLKAESTPRESTELWLATYLLMGLQYPRETANALIRGVRGMKESVTYQAILEEGAAKGQARGRLEALQEVVLDLGGEKFGAPEARIRELVVGIDDPARLKVLIRRVDDVASWKELLADDSSPEPESAT